MVAGLAAFWLFGMDRAGKLRLGVAAAIGLVLAVVFLVAAGKLHSDPRPFVQNPRLHPLWAVTATRSTGSSGPPPPSLRAWTVASSARPRPGRSDGSTKPREAALGSSKTREAPEPTWLRSRPSAQSGHRFARWTPGTVAMSWRSCRPARRGGRGSFHAPRDDSRTGDESAPRGFEYYSLAIDGLASQEGGHDAAAKLPALIR